MSLGRLFVFGVEDASLLKLKVLETMPITEDFAVAVNQVQKVNENSSTNTSGSSQTSDGDFGTSVQQPTVRCVILTPVP